MNKLFIASAVAISAVAIAPISSQAAEQPSFTDVPKDYLFHKEIVDLVSQGVLTGYENGSFLPNKEITRAETAKIIAIALGFDLTSVKNPNFNDVKTTDWFYPYVAVLAEKGIIQGFNGSFSPNAPLSRGDMAIILTKAYNLPLATALSNTFTDVPAAKYYSYYVQTLVNYSITKGDSATTFSPNTYVKRGQLAAFIIRAQAIQPTDTTETPSETPSTSEEKKDEAKNPETPAAGGAGGGASSSAPETVEAILQKHEAIFTSLEAEANTKLNNLLGQAKADLKALIAAGEAEGEAMVKIIAQYTAPASALEASIDASFNTFYNAVIADLTASGHPTSHADSFKTRYNAIKASVVSRIMGQL